MSIKLAKVVAVHPEQHKVDILMLDDGRRVPGVKVMAFDASSSSGYAGLAVPDAQAASDPYAAPVRSERDTIAVVGFYGQLPIVLGFLPPAISEMLFADADRVMHRTPSDFYHTVDGQGNAEWFHPSGAYIRVATDPAHEDLKGKDYNAKFNPKRNADKQVHIHIEQAGGVATVDIAPDGRITITSDPGIDITAPLTTINGDVQVNGQIESTGDQIAGGVSQINHTHGGIVPGPGSTAPPNQ